MTVTDVHFHIPHAGHESKLIRTESFSLPGRKFRRREFLGMLLIIRRFANIHAASLGIRVVPCLTISSVIEPLGQNVLCADVSHHAQGVRARQLVVDRWLVGASLLLCVAGRSHRVLITGSAGIRSAAAKGPRRPPLFRSDGTLITPAKFQLVGCASFPKLGGPPTFGERCRLGITRVETEDRVGTVGPPRIRIYPLVQHQPKRRAN